MFLSFIKETNIFLVSDSTLSVKYVSRKSDTFSENLVCVLFVLRKVRRYVLCEMYVTHLIKCKSVQKMFCFSRSPLLKACNFTVFALEVFKNRVILRYTFLAKITVSRSLLCLFRIILFRRPFRR